MYHYILFDLDGTLTDSKEGILNCLRHAFTKLGDPVPEESTLIRFIGPPLRDSFRQLCGYDEERTKRAIEIFRERYTRIGKFENAAADGLPEVCAGLRERGYVLALASSKPEDMCREICQKFGFAQSLSVIAGAPSGGDSQKSDVILDALRRLGVPNEKRGQVLMVGDRKFDVLGAAQCGIDCLGVEFFGYAEPNELADAGAVAVVKTAEELERFILSN